MGSTTWTRRQLLRGGLVTISLGFIAGCGPMPPLMWPTKARRVGFLGDAPDAQWEWVRDGLRDLSWVEGENLAIERRWARGDNASYPSLVAELVKLGVECIVCGGIGACVPAKQTEKSTPLIAFLLAYDAVDVGLVANIARPEGNMTGMAGVSGLQFHAKVLEILKQSIPNATRVGVVAHSQLPRVDIILGGVQQAAVQLGVQLDIATIQGPNDIESAFQAVGAAGAQAMMILTSTIFLNSRDRIAQLGLAHRLPTIGTDTEFPQAGGLIGSTPSNRG